MLLLAVIACTTPAERPRPKGLQSIPMPQLLAELEGPRSRVRVYNFWATWCRPCLAEMPDLKHFAESNAGVDLVFVNVDMAQLHATKVQRTIERLDLESFEHIALRDPDPAGALGKMHGWPNSIPVTFIVDANGTRRQQFNRVVRASMLERAIAAL